MARVLLIEDDADTSDSIKAMLELCEHEVLLAQHGREAMNLLKKETAPDLILTDILMPEMDGIESIQFIRKNHPDIPVVAMSAQRDTPYLRAAALFGAKVTLHKPFSVQELKDAILKAITLSKPPAP